MSKYDFKPIAPRFWAKVSNNSTGRGCVEWIGATGERGYGQMSVEGRTRRATHVAWFLHYGRWPATGKMLCHSCDNPRCVFIGHLYEGTQHENQRDTYLRGKWSGDKARAASVAKLKAATHCRNGHPYTDVRVGQSGKRAGRRRCMTCYRAREASKRRSVGASVAQCTCDAKPVSPCPQHGSRA